MKRTVLIVALLVFLSAFMVTIAILPEARATTLFVGGAGPGNYTTIQEAIGNASAGDAIHVFNGTYFENIVVGKPLSLVGEDRNTTIIDGSESDDVIRIQSDWVNVTGFTVTNSGLDTVNSGIYISWVQNCSIANNAITYNKYGIRIYGSGHTIANNIVNNNSYGIVLGNSKNNSLIGNTMNRGGIYIVGLDLEHHNTQNIDISNTVNGKPIYYRKNIVGGTIPVGAGQVILANCTGVTVMGQNISDVTRGIALGFSSNNTIVNNTVSRGTWGIFLDVSDDNLIIQNAILSTIGRGIRLDSSTGNTISENTLVSNYGTDIYLYTGSHDNEIMGNTASNSTYCIEIYKSNNNTVSNNTASSCRIDGINVMYSDGNKVSNNMLPSGFDVIWLYESDKNVVEGNVGSSEHNGGISVSYSVGDILVNNTVTTGGMSLGGTLLEHWNTHVIDTTNMVNGKPVYYWKNVTGGTVPSGAGHVTLANCTNITVDGQNVSDGYTGIGVGFSVNITIADNIASSNEIGIYVYSSNSSYLLNSTTSNGGLGIHVSSSNHIVLSNNTVSDNERDGIVIRSSDWNTIDTNTVSANGWDGVKVLWSYRNTISDNTVSSSGQEGVVLQSSDWNEVFNNTVFFNNGSGIEVSYSDGNRLYHNNIVENGNQAYDNDGFNPWYYGYPNGGNYWSDYTGVDQFSGPNQDQPGSDGIGDTSYVIDADSKDHFPLMSPTRTMRPRPPGSLRADLTENELQNVTLTWPLSPDDESGFKSVAIYEVYRSTAFDPEGLGYQLLVVLPKGTSTYVDNYSGEGDANSYFYRVCVVGMLDTRVCAQTQAGKFTRLLSPGPSLVSIPLILSNESIETVLQTVKYDNAWSYDSSSQEWKWYMKPKTYRRGLWNVNHSMGIWINVTEDSNLTSAGIVPVQTTIHLNQGWNLVSFPSFNSSYTVYDLKMDTGAMRVEGYDPSSPHHLRVLGDAEVLQAGYGYWVRVDADIDWTAEVS